MNKIFQIIKTKEFGAGVALTMLVFGYFSYTSAESRVYQIANETIANDTDTQGVSPIFALRTIEEQNTDQAITATTEPVIEEVEAPIYVAPVSPIAILQDITPVDPVIEEPALEVLESEVVEEVAAFVAAPSTFFGNTSVLNFTPLYGDIDLLGDVVEFGGLTSDSAMAVFRPNTPTVDYSFDMTIDWRSARAVQILARVEDSRNFTTCSFDLYGSSARIISTKDGNALTIARSPQLRIPAVEAWKDIQIGMKLEGQKLTCTRDGEPVLSADVEGMASEGDGGLTTWSPYVGESHIFIKKINLF